MRFGDTPEDRTLETAPPPGPGRGGRRGSAHGTAPGLGLRLRVCLHRWKLDRELAYGSARTSAEERALRARQLADRSTRRELARSLRKVSAEAGRARVARFTASVPVDHRALAPWREALLGLAERLERPVEVNPTGVARVLMLLTDGSGPLYNPARDRSVGEALWWVADGLALCPPHRWDCPVIMKLDPEHVAWTCARCGSVATTEDPGVSPA